MKFWRALISAILVVFTLFGQVVQVLAIEISRIETTNSVNYNNHSTSTLPSWFLETDPKNNVSEKSPSTLLYAEEISTTLTTFSPSIGAQISIPGFQISLNPISPSHNTQAVSKIQSGIVLNPPVSIIENTSIAGCRAGENVTAENTIIEEPLLRNYVPLGEAFTIRAFNQSEEILQDFGVESQKVIENRYSKEKATFVTNRTAIEAIIKYDEAELESLGLSEDFVALFSYNEALQKWVKLISVVDKEANEIKVVFHTLNSNLFRLGARPPLPRETPLVILDPDANIGKVTESGHEAEEGTYNVETAENVANKLSLCSIVNVELTHSDPNAPDGSRVKRAKVILDHQSDLDVALTIAYNVHKHSIEHGYGGVSAFYVNVGENEDLADRVISNMHAAYQHIHKMCTNGKCKHPYPSGLGTSVEYDVAEQTSSIPIVRVEVGYLSLDKNRDWIEKDRSLSDDEQKIPKMLSDAIMEFLNIASSCECGELRFEEMKNENFTATKAADKILEEVIDNVKVKEGSVIEVSSTISEGIVISTTPPVIVPGTDLSGIATSSNYKGVTATTYITGNESLTFTLPVDWLYEMSALLSASGGVTTVIPLSFTHSISVPEELLEVMSQTMGIGTCHGLMTWLARHCAGLEALSEYGVNELSELNVDNEYFMENVLWYQIAQLTEEFYSNTLVFTPTTMIEEMLLGLGRPNAPRILTLVPDSDTVDCDEGEVPTGHTLFIIGYITSTQEILAVDPNKMLETTHILLDTTDPDPSKHRWIYRGAPYPPDKGNYAGEYIWTGYEMYAWLTKGVPEFANMSTVHWLGLDSVTSTLFINSIATGGRYHGVGGATVYRSQNEISEKLNPLLAIAGGRYHGVGGTDQEKCVAISLGDQKRPSLPGNLLLPASNQVLELRGAMRGSSAGMTLFNDGNATTLYGSSDPSTVNNVGIKDGINEITVTTNMLFQKWATSFFREVDGGRTNRILGIRETLLRREEEIGLYVSPHNNLFTFDNSNGSDRTYDLILSTVGWPGYTTFLTDNVQIQTGSVQTIAVWDWDLLNVTPIFIYEDVDNDGEIDKTAMLQDILRPTSLHIGSPSYVSDTVTYVTPDTTLSFDVMKATCGISATLYSINGGPSQVFTKPFTLRGLEDGIYTVTFHSIDGIGNVETVNTETLYLYSTPPSLTFKIQGELGIDGWYTPPVTIALQITPTVLPIDFTQVQCKVNKASWQVYTGSIKLDEQGINRISCKIADLAGFSPPVEKVVIPIRSDKGEALHPGDLAMNAVKRQEAYSQIVKTALSSSGLLRLALGRGTCEGIPVLPGDFCLLSNPPLGIPAELQATWTVSNMLAMQGGKIAVFDSPFAWEAGHILNMLNSYLSLSENTDYIRVDEESLNQKQGLSDVSFLVLPSVPLTATESVESLLGPTGLDYLAQFVQSGGTIYAIGTSIHILESAGIISGVLNLDQPVYATQDVATIESLQPEHPLSLNWLTSTVYMPQSYVLQATDHLTTIAIYTGTTNYPSTPAILYGEIGYGRLVLVNNKALVSNELINPPSLSYPPFINALLLALSEPSALLAQAQQTYDDGIDYDLFPAGQVGIPVDLTIAFDLLSEKLVQSIIITETIAKEFVVLPEENPGWEIYASSNGTQMVRKLNIGTIQLHKDRIVFPILARTNAITSLLSGNIAIASGYANITYIDGYSTDLYHDPVYVKAVWPAETFWQKRIWPEILNGIRDTGKLLEIAIGVVNWHDTPAYTLKYTETVPIWVPMLDTTLQTPLKDHKGQNIWGKLSIIFPYAPLPDQAKFPGQTFDWQDWNGRDVYTMTLPAGVDIQLPSNISSDGCDSPFPGINCCQQNTGFGNAIRIVRTPTQTLLILPAIVFTWSLDDLNGYEYRDPIIRYQLNVVESFEREVQFAANYDPYDEEVFDTPHTVFLASNGSFWAALGHSPLNLLGKPVNAPIFAHREMASVEDLWKRELTATTSALYVNLVAPTITDGKGTGASELNITSKSSADIDGDNQQESPLTDVPADQPVTVCLYTALQDMGRSNGLTSTLVLRFPWGLGYQIQPLRDSWENSWEARYGHAVYSDTLRGNGEDWVRFEVNLNSGEQEWITTCIQILPYPGILHEGYRTFFNGALYYYPFDRSGTVPIYHLETSYIQAAWAVMHNPEVSSQALPLKVGRNGDTLYYMVSADDLNAQHLSKPYIYIATYGDGKFASTTYLGGTINRKLRDPQLSPGDEVLLRVELSNNSSQIWENLNLHMDLPDGIMASLYTPSLDEPGALSERPHLTLSAIENLGWGVYYYKLKLDPDYDGEFGKVITIPISVTGDNLPTGIVIPPARLSIVNEEQLAIDPIGIADELSLEVGFSNYYTPTQCAVATQGQLSELKSLWYVNPGTFTQKYNELPQLPIQVISNTTNTMYLGLTRVRLEFTAPADKLPAEEGPYTVICSGSVPQLGTEHHRVPLDIQPTLNFKNHFGYISTFTHTNIEFLTGGPVLKIQYQGVPTGTDTTSAFVRVNVSNTGDDIAQNTTLTLSFPITMTITPLEGDCQPLVQSGSQWNMVCEVRDLTPYGLPDESIAFMLQAEEPIWVETLIPETDGDLLKSESPDDMEPLSARYITKNKFDSIIRPVESRYFNAFVERWEQVMLDVALWQVDLMVSDISYTPSNLVQKEPAIISVTVTNNGPDTVYEDFWVDLYLNPTTTVKVNTPWYTTGNWGIAWKVYTDLEPGESIILTSESTGDAKHPGTYSHWYGSFPMSGEVQVTVLADSYGDYIEGAVSEIDETQNIYTRTVSVEPGYTVFLPLILRQK